MRHVIAILLVALCAWPVRSQDAPLGVAVPIDDPRHRVLPRVRAALDRARRGEGVARLSFWGASHTASDQYTGFLRERLQRRFGDAGAGLVMPAIPFALYERRDVTMHESAGWRGVRVRGAERAPDRYGRAGFAVETTTASWARVRASSVAHAELWASGAGTVELRVDDAIVANVPLAPGTMFLEAEVARGSHVVEARARGDGPVRVFGMLLESGQPGVIVESFGVPGARARDQLPWDEAELRAQIARRPPDLVALAYGTNETGDRTPMSTLDRDLRAVIARWHRVAPESACLVIGPSDWMQSREGALGPRARTTEVRDLYRRIALAEGCGFFDLLALQGGPGAIARWVAMGWALNDHVHMTDEGHARVAELLERALIAR
ncbi:GDSL-type esterase/lipase family protein [Sandaracinus amylolyticus]|uniref:GDSL-type esterase/lipase family protein n=1 Tax=Sandaracinus amylolyticus TaxID=927083 RepID=UPI001F47EDDA|nr:GDSL-type esterase/lipase family protein [Sandaracinus amylolyticus]UJR85345.1 Hypothetical protein I5071_74250 [Sandaracinus amylolyticus]